MNKALTLVFLCGWFCGLGQTPDWVWARSASSVGAAEGFGVAVDNSDNTYQAGEFITSITFGSQVLTAGQGSYIAKYNSNGSVLWARSSSGGTNNAYSVIADNFGNVYLTGYFTSTTNFGPFTLTSAGNDDIFLAKYDSSGNILWAKRAGGPSVEIAYGVAADASGNVYISGYFNSTSFTIGSYLLTSAGGADLFLAKYDSAGNVLWVKSAGGSGSDVAYGLATDSRGNVYITGEFASPNMLFSGITVPYTVGGDIFIAKYDSSGNIIWAKGAGGNSTDISRNIAIDASGNAYIAGYYISTSLTIGTSTLFNLGATDAFIAKYDSSGNALWARNIGGTSSETGYAIATDGYNHIVMTGGYYSPSISVGSLTLVRPGGNSDPLFIAGFDSTGGVTFAKQLASGGDDQHAVAANHSGCFYVGSDFSQAALIVGNDTLIKSGGAENTYIAKLCFTGVYASFTSSDTAFCNENGECINFFDHSTGSPTSWQWHFAGATPDTSSLQNPTNICYNTPGTYPVSLIVGDGTSYDTLTVSPLIIFGSAPAVPTITVLGADTLVSSFGYLYQWFLNGNAIAGATDSFYVAYQGGTYAVQVSDSLGSCHSISNGVLITAVNSFVNAEVKIYPNPADVEITIYNLQFSRDAIVEIYNAVGVKINTSQSAEITSTRGISDSTEWRLGVSELNDGIYFLKMRGGLAGEVNKKFVVLHK